VSELVRSHRGGWSAGGLPGVQMAQFLLQGSDARHSISSRRGGQHRSAADRL